MTEHDDRTHALDLAANLAATGRTDVDSVVNLADDFLGFLRPCPALRPDTSVQCVRHVGHPGRHYDGAQPFDSETYDDVIRVPREVAQGHAARLRRLVAATPPSTSTDADLALAALLDPQQ